MGTKKLNKRDPHDPEVVAAIIASIREMPPDELWAMLKRRPEGVEETNMNEDLAEYDRRQAQKAADERAA